MQRNSFELTNVRLPGWEAIHEFQISSAIDADKRVVLLRRAASAEEPLLAVGKIATTYADSSTNPKRDDETDGLTNKVPPGRNIIRVLSVHDDVPRLGQTTMVLEHCDGEDLLSLSRHACLTRTRIPEAFIWHVLYHVLLVLHRLDECSTCHGDLHLGNVLLRGTGDQRSYPDVVVADFGMAGTTEGRGSAGAMGAYDFAKFGRCLKELLLDAIDQNADDDARYSKELGDFVLRISGDLAGGSAPTGEELEDELGPFAWDKARAVRNGNLRMPEWMVSYFDGLKRKIRTRGRAEARATLEDGLLGDIAWLDPQGQAEVIGEAFDALKSPQLSRCQGLRSRGLELLDARDQAEVMDEAFDSLKSCNGPWYQELRSREHESLNAHDQAEVMDEAVHALKSLRGL